MSTNFSGSAKIYTFPARGRFAVSAQRDEFKSVANVQLPQGVEFASGGAWYHEEAIQAEQGRKN
jgi:uncharacterized protein DUF2735